MARFFMHYKALLGVVPKTLYEVVGHTIDTDGLQARVSYKDTQTGVVFSRLASEFYGVVEVGKKLHLRFQPVDAEGVPL